MRLDNKKIKQFSGHTIIYGLGDALYKAIAFILLPVYLKYLTPDDYGVLETMTVTRELGITILSLGIPSALLKYYHSRKKQGVVISTAFWAYILFQIPIPALLIIFNANFSQFVLNTEQYAVCFSILALNMSLISFRLIPLTLYRAENRSVKYSVVTFLVALITLLGNIFFIVIAKMGIEGVLWGNFLGGLSGVFLVFVDIKKHIRFEFDTQLIRKMCKYGLPIALATLPLNIIFMNDRYFLSNFYSLDELGRYALATKFSRLLLVFFITPFQLSWVPFILENSKLDQAEELFAKIGASFYYIGLNVSLAICLYAPIAIAIMAPSEYGKVYFILPVLCCSVLLYGLGFVFRSGILVSEQTGIITKILLIGMMVNLLSNLFLVPEYGMYGASFSLALCFGLIAVLSYIEGQKRVKVEYSLFKMGVITGLAVLSVLLFYSLFDRLELLYAKIVFAVLINCVFIFFNHVIGIINFYELLSFLRPGKMFKPNGDMFNDKTE